MLKKHQVFYFDITVRNDAIKKTISSPYEFEFIDYLSKLGYKKNIDFIHQFPCAQEDMSLLFIADFCFPNEKLIIELDGKSHKPKKAKDKDTLRDNVFTNNGYCVLRINTPMSDYDKSFYKVIITDFIKEKRYEQETELD